MKINPFRPNSPVNPGMFVGRLAEINLLEQHLVQTMAGNPSNFMITGERGIGKSSLLNYFKWVASGTLGVGVQGPRLKFLVLDVDVDGSTSELGLIRKFELAMRKSLATSEPARAFMKNAWEFLERVEAAGVRIGAPSEERNSETLFDEFSYTLSETAARICSAEAPTTFSSKYDGILLLIDEADNSRSFGLGSFCKLLTERLHRRSCSHVMIGLAGLEGLRTVLSQSHPSSLRLFEEISLGRLNESEIGQVLDLCLDQAEKDNGQRTVMTDGARVRIARFSEGYPHFLQQFGYSAFAVDTDDVIDEVDFDRGALGKNGAMEQIGDRYYRDSFYIKIQQESYRQVLRIMADHLDGWVTKSAIRSKFKGRKNTLDNALLALRTRGIILSKEGERGVYRLQHKGFALWIKLFTTDPQSLENLTLPIPEP